MTIGIAPPLRVVRLFPAHLIARVTGASVRSAQRWRAGQRPQTRFRDRIDELQGVLDILGSGMTDAAKRDWLEAPSPALGWARPLDRMAEGAFDDVRGAAESYVVGDYA